MKTTETAQPPLDPDNQLADFTDRLLAGDAAPPTPASDPDARALEQTVIRLHRAFPQTVLDQRTRQQLQANFGQRVRQEEGQASRSSWWSRQPRERWIVAAVVAALLVVFLLAPGFLTSTGGNIQGTAGTTYQNIGLFLVLAVILVFLIWLGRRR